MTLSGRTLSIVLVLALVADIVLAQDASSTTARPSGAAAGAAGGVYTDEVLTGMKTVWGHDDHAAGAESVGEEALARVDLPRGVRDYTASAGCRQALDELVQARSKLRLWALKMHSSSVVLPEAILSGAMSHMGDYDACLSVPDAMYCLVETEVRPLSAARKTPHQGDEVSPFDPPNGANATLWDLLKTSGNFRRYRRDNQQWALCLPAKCGQSIEHRSGPSRAAVSPEGARQLGVAVAGAITGMARSLGVQVRVHIDPTDCYTNRAKKADEPSQLRTLLKQPSFFFGSAFILLFPVLTFVTTARYVVRKLLTGSGSDLELNTQKQGMMASLMQCFVVQRNWENLFRKQKSQIHSIQGLRVVTNIGVIAGHRMIFPFGGPVFNPEFYEGFFTQPSKMFLVNGHGIVATFFVIIAFLEARLCMTIYTKMNYFSWTVLFSHYVYRYFRIVPAMAVMIAFNALWLEHLGSGPLWNQLVVGGEVRLCKTIWWQNFLFVSNVMSPGTQCLVQTWFLAASMQMYLATPLVMWVVFLVFRCSRRAARRAPWPGCTVLGLLLIASVLVLYACTAALGLLPTTPLYPMYLRRLNLVTDPTFIHQYVATHANLVPYVVGLATGTLFYLANLREWKPSQWTRWVMLVGIPVTGLLQAGATMAGVAYMHPSGGSPWLGSLYAPVRLLAFSVPTAWIVFTCGMGCGGVVSRALTWTPLLALGRITYSVYLVHLAVTMATAASTKQPLHLSTATFIRSVVADVILSYGFGFLLYMCVEAPVSNVLKVLTEQSLQEWEEKACRAKETPQLEVTVDSAESSTDHTRASTNLSHF